MAKQTPDPASRYQELMRNAGQHRRAISARMLENERRFSGDRQRIEQQRTHEERTSRVQNDLRRHAEQVHLAAAITHELADLIFKLAATTDSEERILLTAEIAHLSGLKDSLKASRRRKPPESGVPVPAVLPDGPLPKQGGAAAPLEFGS